MLHCKIINNFFNLIERNILSNYLFLGHSLHQMGHSIEDPPHHGLQCCMFWLFLHWIHRPIAEEEQNIICYSSEKVHCDFGSKGLWYHATLTLQNITMFSVFIAMVVIKWFFNWIYVSKVKCLSDKCTDCTLCLGQRERFWEKSNSINFPVLSSFIKGNTVLQFSMQVCVLNLCCCPSEWFAVDTSLACDHLLRLFEHT